MKKKRKKAEKCYLYRSVSRKKQDNSIETVEPLSRNPTQTTKTKSVKKK